MCSCPRVGNTRHWLSTLAVRSSVSRNVANGLLATGIPRFLSSRKVKSGLNVMESVVSITECPEALDSSYRQSSGCRGVAFLANRKSVHSEEGWPVVPPTDPRKSLEKPDHNK
jgi:hypothetical protein